MTGADLAQRLAQRGLDESEIPAKAALFDDALRGLSLLGAVPERAWWVPGRLEAFGKHTDYAGGRTLVAALPRGFALVAAPRADGRITVLDARSGERVAFGPEPATFTGWRHYAEIALKRLGRNFPGSHPGADIALASDLPQAAGMSSSSALLVGVAAALARIWQLDLRSEWTSSIHGLSDVAMYFACIENGQTFRELAGDSGVGTFGGSEDHTAMLLGTAANVSAFSYLPVRGEGQARLPVKWRFVIASSGVAAEKTGRARVPYNRLSEGAGVLLQIWSAAGEKADSLAAALRSSESAAERLRDLVRQSKVPGWPHEALSKRLDHFCSEDARVPDALRAFREADTSELGALSQASQDDAERLLGNQIPETIALAREARTSGAFAACSFGAGFGGSVWALVESERAHEFARVWLDAYRRVHDAPEATSFVATPGPPLVELT